MDTSAAEIKLRERVKELTCLYDITSAVLMHDTNIVQTLDKIARAVKAAYQYVDDAVIEIWLESHYILTQELCDETVSQSSTIKVFSDELGFIKVHYPVKTHTDAHFLNEEQLLLDKVAIEIGSFFEKLIIMEREKLFQRNISHADRLAVLHEITAGIAHELNTPLGNILGFAELIREGNTDSQIDDDLSKIINSAIYAREIVKKLMLFSGDVPSHPEDLDLVSSIGQCLSILSPNLKKKGIELLFSHDESHPRLCFDSIHLTQIIFNIILNAIYASPAGGVIKVQLSRKNGSITIAVADEGPGVPEELKNKIFEPFFTTKPIGEGTGLGLSVVHGIVKKHGGNIVIKDNLPLGALFEVQLPEKP